MADFTPKDFKRALELNGGRACKALLQDPKAYKATFDLLKATVSKNPIAAVSAVTSGSSAAAKALPISTSTKSHFREGSMAFSTFKASIDLAKIATFDDAVFLVKATSMASPTRAMVVIGASVVHKTGLAVSLVGGDNEKAKCLGAVMELAGSGAVTVLTLPSAATGVGAVVVVLSAASLVSSAVNAYQSCHGLMVNGSGSPGSPGPSSSPAPSPPASQGPVSMGPLG